MNTENKLDRTLKGQRSFKENEIKQDTYTQRQQNFLGHNKDGKFGELDVHTTYRMQDGRRKRVGDIPEEGGVAKGQTLIRNTRDRTLWRAMIANALNGNAIQKNTFISCKAFYNIILI